MKTKQTQSYYLPFFYVKITFLAYKSDNFSSSWGTCTPTFNCIWDPL